MNQVNKDCSPKMIVKLPENKGEIVVTDFSDGSFQTSKSFARKTYFMNVATGSVDSLQNWLTEIDFTEFDAALADRSMVEVELADGSPVPEDFNPCNSSDYDWQEV